MFFTFLFVFLEFAVIFGTFGVMGDIGNSFYAYNFRLFGALSYFYPLALLYLGLLYYKNKTPMIRYVEICLASIFLFLILLILQSLCFKIGVFGNAVIDFLKPHLGVFGILVLCFLGIGTCFLSYKNEDIVEIVKGINIATFLHRAKMIYSLGLQKILICGKIIKNKIQTILKAQIEKRKSPLQIPNKGDTDFLDSLNLNHQDTHLISNLKDKKMIEKKIEVNTNEEIKIQEYIITPIQEEKKASIRIVDEIPQQKENPFLAEVQPFIAQKISSSAELLKKIKDKQSNPIPTQDIQTKQSFAPEEQKEQKEQKEEEKILQTQKTKETLKDFKQNIPQTLIKEEECFIEQHITSPEEKIEEKIEEKREIVQETKQEEIPLSKNPSTPFVGSTQKIPQKTHTHIKTLEENEALLKEIDQGKLAIPKNYELPPLSLLAEAKNEEEEIDEAEIDAKISNLLAKLSVFKIDGDVIRTYSGPIITTLEFRPAPNVKVSRIESLENDIAMALEAKSIRIQAPIPGKNVVGIEIPNTAVQTIYLREIFESEIFKNSSSPLTLALGKDVVGNPFVTDLKKLPHLLIAGTTGSGKSVGINAMILSLLYRNSPDDLKLMMVDPKMVEFMPYTDLPHLITPIITDPKKAIIGLANAVREMERRYTLMSQMRVKEIVSYNQKAQEMGFEKFPYFVIIIDELADLMMTAGKEVEYSMARIAQMGRASGMHLIVATQSPRADILTGLIKTNLPSHLSYKVGTKIDAGIIGCAGAETLLGRGDMLFTPPGVSGLIRLHAPWSSEKEVDEIVSYIKAQREVIYDPLFSPEEKEAFGAMDCNELDEEMKQLVEQAKQIILQDGKSSISYLQRRLSIGYNKAATIVETLEQIGFLSPPDAKGNRQIL